MSAATCGAAPRLWSVLRGPSGRGAQAARAAGAAAALPRARRADVHRAGAGHRRGAGAAVPGGPRDRRWHPAAATPDALTVIVVAFVGAALVERAGHLRADLPRQLGRTARAPGPAAADLRAPAAAVDRLLLAQQRRRADLADDERRPGAGPARHRRDRDAVLLGADAGRHGRDPVLPGSRAGADHVPDLPAAGDRAASSSGSPRPARTG